MNISNINPPLSNVQAELLKLFATDIPENELIDLKIIIAKFLLDRARTKADIIWNEKGYSDENLAEIIARK